MIPTVTELQHLCQNTLISHLNITLTQATPVQVCGTMPVTACVKQPFGILHGGASVVLLETLASIGGMLNVDPEQHYCVGLEVNANHLKAMTEGIVQGCATPIHRGRQTQVWGVEICNEQGAKVCVGRITLAVRDKHS
jgi:1,4-dihydroxy-2-naphthoyl-CoA hydrolase